MEDLEVNGVFLQALASACLNLRVITGAEALREVDPSRWYPATHFHAMFELIEGRFGRAEPIKERIGIEMMRLWYEHGGRDAAPTGLDFLRFQTGSRGYGSLVRGSAKATGEFALEALDERKGTAVVRSSTHFDRSMERGVLLGGLKAAGDLAFIDVTNERDSSVFEVRFVDAASSSRSWEYRALQLEHARERAFSDSMTETLAKTCEALARTSGELARLDRLQPRSDATALASSPAMASVLALALAVAKHATTVLLTGETGSGKGVVARRIHDMSPRNAKPFVELNCAGLQRELTEAELFGYERGAFTGATTRKIGLFEAAEGGTLFLDEIGELDLNVQAKLLRVVEERRFRRLGGLEEMAVDVRLIAATHQDLALFAKEGLFRNDLLYRLNVFSIHVPPLRERREDILPLARHFLVRYAGSRATLTREAEQALADYAWPGNVRELRNVIERAMILAAPDPIVRPSHLPNLGQRGSPARARKVEPPLASAERTVITKTLEASGGNISVAARALGVSRGMLYRKITKYELGPKRR